MNNIQKVVSAISGYEPKEMSAKNDYYYDECHTVYEKLVQIKEYAKVALSIDLNLEDMCHVFEFLELEPNLQDNERYHAFINL